jgi:hypothetical protein
VEQWNFLPYLSTGVIYNYERMILKKFKYLFHIALLVIFSRSSDRTKIQGFTASDRHVYSFMFLFAFFHLLIKTL